MVSKETKVIDIKEVNIIKERRQLSVRFPKEFEEKFTIDSKKDKFFWKIIQDEDGISLKGELIKGV